VTDISVIVVNYNRDENLRLCLWGLEQQDMDHEMIVTDDGSKDQSLPIAQTSGATVIWHPHNDRRTAAARWRGAQVATGELLVFIDSDVVLAPWALSAYWDAYKQCPDRALGGYCKQLPGMFIVNPDWHRLWTCDYPTRYVDQGSIVVGKDPREAAGQMFFFDDPDVLWEPPLSLVSGNMAVPRHVYDAAGGWDRDMVGRGQDGEFSIRVAKAGYPFSYLMEAQSVHLAHERKESPGNSYDYIRAKHPDCYQNGHFVWPPRKD
jgi:GT2 family glycosyltransferase